MTALVPHVPAGIVDKLAKVAGILRLRPRGRGGSRGPSCDVHAARGWFDMAPGDRGRRAENA